MGLEIDIDESGKYPSGTKVKLTNDNKIERVMMNEETELVHEDLQCEQLDYIMQCMYNIMLSLKDDPSALAYFEIAKKTAKELDNIIINKKKQ